MSPTVIGLALLAAILHATWNAFLRTGADRLWTVTVMSFASTAVALPFAIYYGLPSSEVWPYVVASAGLQVVYCLFLVAAYRQGELGQVYPIVRGSVPLLVLLGASVMAHRASVPAADRRRQPGGGRDCEPRLRQGQRAHRIDPLCAGDRRDHRASMPPSTRSASAKREAPAPMPPGCW